MSKPSVVPGKVNVQKSVQSSHASTRPNGQPSKVAAIASSSGNESEMKKFMSALSKKVVKEIKKTAHNDKKKPYTTVTEGVPTRDFASEIMGEYGKVTSNTKAMERREFNSHEEIALWLGLTEDEGLIHPVKFDGKVWCLAGSKPQIHAWARFESLIVTIKGNTMELKCRTFMCGSGRPISQF